MDIKNIVYKIWIDKVICYSFHVILEIKRLASYPTNSRHVINTIHNIKNMDTWMESCDIRLTFIPHLHIK